MQPPRDPEQPSLSAYDHVTHMDDGRMDTDDEQQVVSMQLLSTIVNTEVLSQVKSHLKGVHTNEEGTYMNFCSVCIFPELVENNGRDNNIVVTS